MLLGSAIAPVLLPEMEPYIQTPQVQASPAEGDYIDSWDISSESGDAISLTTDGANIWVIDYVDTEVYKYSMTGTYLDHFDISGQSSDGYGITTDGSNIWIADWYDDEIYRYTMAGGYVDSWDTSGQTGWLYGIATDGNFIWILDYNAREVYKYSMAGVYTTEHWDTSGQTTDATEITTDGNYIWAVSPDDAEVYKYHMNGTYISSWDTSVQSGDGYGVTTDGINIWIVDHPDDEVYKYEYMPPVGVTVTQTFVSCETTTFTTDTTSSTLVTIWTVIQVIIDPITTVTVTSETYTTATTDTCTTTCDTSVHSSTSSTTTCDTTVQSSTSSTTTCDTTCSTSETCMTTCETSTLTSETCTTTCTTTCDTSVYSSTSSITTCDTSIISSTSCKTTTVTHVTSTSTTCETLTETECETTCETTTITHVTSTETACETSTETGTVCETICETSTITHTTACSTICETFTSTSTSSILTTTTVARTVIYDGCVLDEFDDDTLVAWYNNTHRHDSIVDVIHEPALDIPDGILTLVGTLDSGNLASVQTFDDADSYNVSEVVGSPSYDIRFNFTGLTDEYTNVNCSIYVWYSGGAGHTVEVHTWNYTSGTWIVCGEITEAADFGWFNFSRMGAGGDIVRGGILRGRIVHTSSGNINHDIFIDYIEARLDICPCGQVYSENMLEDLNATAIVYFRYNITITPYREAFARVRFSQDNTTWVDSDGIAQWEEMVTGDNSILLTGLDWAGNFYYRIWMHKDVNGTSPTLDLAQVCYSTIPAGPGGWNIVMVPLVGGGVLVILFAFTRRRRR